MWVLGAGAPPPARLIERGVLSVESIVEGLLRKFLYYTPISPAMKQFLAILKE